MRLPSGDHTGEDAPSAADVTRLGSPPFTSMTKSWDFSPCRVETKARRVPSGDQRGCVSDVSPLVNLHLSPVSSVASQMADRLAASDSENVSTT
jgi:hypothetical protein